MKSHTNRGGLASKGLSPRTDWEMIIMGLWLLALGLSGSVAFEYSFRICMHLGMGNFTDLSSTHTF